MSQSVPGRLGHEVTAKAVGGDPGVLSGRQRAELDIAEVDPIAVFLQKDVTLRPFAKAGNIFELALRDAGAKRG